MKKLTIGQMSLQLGLGRETLRHYENIGLVKPNRECINGYRYYNEMDGLNILHTRQLQSYGMQLNSIHEKMRMWSLSEQEECLRIRERNLRNELAELELRLARIHRIRGFIEDSITSPGKFWESDVNGLYKILVLGDHVKTSPQSSARAKEWGAKFPITDIGWHIFMADVTHDESARIPISICLTVLPEYVDAYGFQVDPPVFFYPSGHTIRTILSIDSPFDLHYSDIRCIFDYANENDYTIVSDLTGRYGGCEFIDGKPKFFFTLRAIVTKNKS